MSLRVLKNKCIIYSLEILHAIENSFMPTALSTQGIIFCFSVKVGYTLKIWGRRRYYRCFCQLKATFQLSYIPIMWIRVEK